VVLGELGGYEKVDGGAGFGGEVAVDVYEAMLVLLEF